mmetsp:Transcript_12903/g.17642  ORF Transcript_12903/g.17642 Transcript_12903/m.17642 type:complete len:250 (-) Transcript_12903:126-875(-)|eukprot:CAMPEP_0196579884 /NCGR_PEP_ID=MMETSP1081-20130531/25493_1 /TAXON_ID=36882 /ORGANISM="Pyramimonas amylifera, Strain CCMP720" /LENGTH=249 /DNA_ID=CAMNT_0041899597 /DNA_START=122 /DNA_END=871 /DNA_ORIENTATION=-
MSYGMGGNESIYQLIPQREIVPPKDPMHRSKYSGKVDPKTFPMGEPKRPLATFGPPQGLSKPVAKNFTKKHAGEPVLPDPKAPTHPKEKVKAPVPLRDEKPVMGLMSAKNFITANAVENILSQAKKVPEAPKMAVDKVDYGKTPSYLKTVKQKINQEKAMVEEFKTRMYQQQQTQSSAKKMSEDERQDLISQLKSRWQHVNESYQKMTFTLDTPAKKMRKEKYEEQLVQIEKDIETLSRRVVLVAEDEY